jgi:hypothetical protein
MVTVRGGRARGGHMPQQLFVHLITVEAYEGAGAYGPVYAAPVEVACLLDQQTKLVRSPSGGQVVSSSTALCPLDTVCPPASRVTLPGGRVTTVINALRRDGGPLPVPSHLEVQAE